MKRFTDAELAAIHWMLFYRRERMAGYGDAPGSPTWMEAAKAAHQISVVERFATTPSYDEGPA